MCAFPESGSALQWFSPTPSGNAPDGLSVSGKTVYVASTTGSGSMQSGALYALNASTGALDWQTAFGSAGGNTTSPPAVAGGLVYVKGSNDNLYAFDVKNGKSRWTDTGAFVSAPSLANGVLYIDDGHRVDAIDAKNGKVLWTSPAAGSSNGAPLPPEVANGVLYIANTAGAGACSTLCAYSIPSSQFRRQP